MDGLEEERLAFAEELEEVALQLSMLDPEADVASQLETVGGEYERLAMTAEMFMMPDMQGIVNWAQSALSGEAAADLLMTGKFFGWLEMTALILREPDEVSHLPLLMGELMDPGWPDALDADQLQNFLLSLRPPESEASEGSAEAATDDNTGDEAATATETRKPLAFPEDIHPELLSAYLGETPEHISEAARLIRLIAIGASDADQRRSAARLAHTVKGSSGVVGIDAIARFTHKLEDLLDLPFKQVPDGLSDTLEASADCLESMFDNLQGSGELPGEYSALEADLSEWIGKLENLEEEAEPVKLPELTDLPDFIATPEASEADAASTTAVTPVAAAPVNLGEDRIQQLLNLTGELITSTSQIAELVQQSMGLSKQLYAHDDQMRQRLDELENVIDDQASHVSAARRELTVVGQDAAVPDTGLDDLELDSYSDLYSTTNLLVESAADSREMTHELQQRIRHLTDELYQQQRLQRQLSDVVLATRLTPVSTLTSRVERIVRETCRKTGKKAKIEIQGQHLNIDSDILKGVTDPLLHMLRNAIDHGIELPEQRKSTKKKVSGRLTLTFSQQGNHVTLLLEDDGQGIDTKKVRARALERGLIRKNQRMSKDEILRLILQPGFSTQDEISEVSGRGVGMDVVHSAVEQMRGTLHISSEPGEGTKIRIEVPQTLIATHALIVRVSGNLVAIPADTIEQLLYVSADESKTKNKQWHIETERYQLPVTRLANILGWAAEDVDQQQSHTLLIVSSETQTYALHVDAILPSRDIVIKNLAPWLSHIHSLQGASVLADGAVAPVLDTIRLLHQLENGELSLDTTQAKQVKVKKRSRVLVVDDSLSNRKSLRLMLEQMDYEVATAVDGLDALQAMNASPMDMILTDLEMPRMTGLEMTQAIRIWPEMKHLPIVMLTSRSTQKHRQLAEQAGVDAYLTKPVQAAELEQELTKWLDTRLAAA